MTQVLNLATGETFTYSCAPDQAVIAAYAQSKGDYNTYDYAKYRNLLRQGDRVVTCGDLTALR